MLSNYIKIAFRNMMRNKGYTFINISGLAIGMAACILILLFVQRELSYDKYHENADRIVRVSRAWINADGETSLHLGNVAPPFAPLLKGDFEGIVLNAVRFLNDAPLLTYEEISIEEEKFFFVDPDVFEVFSWKMLKGDPKTALIEPNTIVMTSSAAERYFGEEDPIGKVINYNDLVDVKVTGIIEEIPSNSHFTFDFLGSFSTIENYFGRESMMSNWGSNNYTTYLLLPEGYDYMELQNQLGGFLNNHLEEYNGIKPEVYNNLTLWPLTSIHLHSHLDSEVEPNGDIAYVYIFSAVAFLILIIACINFMNLSTAKSTKRAKEVGLRKVMGAFRLALIRQFLTESIIFAIISFIMAYVIVSVSLPTFNNFIQKELSISPIDNQWVIILFITITLFVGLLAGGYPALYLSKFQPAVILKGQSKTGDSKINFRSVLVVLQFFISICLIISVGIIQQQLKYVKSKPLGFNKDNLLVLPVNDKIYENYESIRDQLIQRPGINDVTLTSRVPSGRLLDSQGAQAEIGGDIKDIDFRIADVHVDHHFLSALEVPFKAGRNFDPNLASDSTEAFILNEAAIKAIGWSSNEEAIDKQFNYGMRKGRVVGVVEDFHFESLHQVIAPIVFLVTSGRSRNMVLRLNPADRDESLAFLEEQWSYYMPGYPFSHYWLDQRFDQQYENEDRLSELIQIFSLLAVFIAALGLFGLASFITEQRVKEIGVRKVMGASIGRILILLTKNFTYLVLIAFVLACPVAYYFMEKWLDNFSYQTGLSIGAFIIGGLFALIVAWVTVGYQCYKAASKNPIDALKYE